MYVQCLNLKENDARGKQIRNCINIDVIKIYNVKACLDSAEKLFQYITPLNNKRF